MTLLTIVLIGIIAWLTSQLLAPSTTIDAACARPELASLTATSQADNAPACFYSRTYQEARSRFLDAVKKSGLPFEVHALPIGHKGLFVDVALLRRRSDALLLHISGTHGTEGFVGSAIQTALLAHTNDSAGIAAAALASADAPSLLFVHALNAFGMATFRRWNEDGIDLNRNALFTPPQWADVLARDQAEYDELDPVVNPHEPPTLLSLLALAPRMALQYATRFVETKRALVSATYRTAGGIFYGGQRLATSHQLLAEFLASSGLAASVKRLTLIDVHSGLGPIGQDTLMFSDAADRGCYLFGGKDVSPAAAACEGMSDGNFTADSPSLGYERTVGTVNEPKGYPSLFVNAKRDDVLSLAQEFGTVPPVFVVLALIRENQAFRFGDEAQRRQFGQLVYDTFVPVTREARTNTVRRGVILFQQALNDLLTKK